MGAIHYRRAELADVPRLVGLPRAGEAGGDPRMGRYLAGEHHPGEALAARAMWLAADGDAPVGYVAGHLTRRLGCDGELQWIYVAAGYRRAGVGTRLLALLAEWFVAAGARRVCVDVGDAAARPFYERRGAVALTGPWMVWRDIGTLAGAGR